MTGLNTAFQAKALSDVINSSNDGGSKVYSFLTDWTHFSNQYRGWGLDGGNFVSENNRGKCDPETAGPSTLCRIWDWRLNASSSYLRAITTTVATGDEVLTYFRAYNDVVNFLNHAVERMEDGIGNENTLCESNEHCVFSPNIGRYQGDGPLVLKQSAGNFVGGVLTNITMWEYSANGVP